MKRNLELMNVSPCGLRIDLIYYLVEEPACIIEWIGYVPGRADPTGRRQMEGGSHAYPKPAYSARVRIIEVCIA